MPISAPGAQPTKELDGGTSGYIALATALINAFAGGFPSRS